MVKKLLIAILSALIYLPAAHAVNAQYYGGTDLNGYSSERECYNGGTVCDVAAVDTAATASCTGSPYTTADTIQTVMNSASAGDVICVTNGDYSSQGTVTVTKVCTSANWCILRLYRSSDTNDDPVDQSSANRAIFKRMVFNGAKYWIIERITWEGAGQSTANVYMYGGATNLIFDRTLNEDADTGDTGLFYINNSATTATIAIQNSVIRSVVNTPGSDGSCFYTANVYDVTVVNSEIYACNSVAFRVAAGGRGNFYLENNDIYVPTTNYYDCSGGNDSSNPDAKCAANEGLISVKRNDASYISYFTHNRLWGSRHTDLNVCCNGGTNGQAISLSTPGEAAPPQASYVALIDNIVWDSQYGVLTTREGPINNSVIGNIFYRIKDFYLGGDTGALYVSHFDDSEGYLNDIIDSDTWLVVGSDGNAEYRCNAVINSGAISGTSAGTLDYNTYYGGSTSSETHVNDNTAMTVWSASHNFSAGDIICGDASDCTNANYIYTVLVDGGSSGASEPTWAAGAIHDGDLWLYPIRGPYTFYYKLRTNPTQKTIPKARLLYTSADEASYCPGTGETDALGSAATDIGVNNDELGDGGIMDTGIIGAR